MNFPKMVHDRVITALIGGMGVMVVLGVPLPVEESVDLPRTSVVPGTEVGVGVRVGMVGVGEVVGVVVEVGVILPLMVQPSGLVPGSSLKPAGRPVIFIWRVFFVPISFPVMVAR